MENMSMAETKITRASEIKARPVPLIKRYEEWGPWQLDVRHTELVFRLGREDYYRVDLYRCNTASEIDGWIRHIYGRRYMGESNTGFFVAALDDVLHVSANETLTRADIKRRVKEAAVKWPTRKI
jgi:hypothetical protein